ncbi:hypothetical protein OZX72_00610 [Bifidobacterium sp. ESL0769]|uniref:hypothetical protein n=1 Tax=Bifidobacterium sp. ESL0769 TaxID=2983229 RepID=UPI0023FA3C0E|nr:hypothetical protein [Bifidobacterium sp. ESL0769]WEV67540.1 hypothetical protein OZX72_00575 [Bifidobacterium sp. ESL0769]WEV67544.1 hypothetical protein OZX72_00610 [Bifidobacterium sp. ESL0769]
MLASTIQFSSHHAHPDQAPRPGPPSAEGIESHRHKDGVAIREPKSMPTPLICKAVILDLFHTSRTTPGNIPGRPDTGRRTAS